MGYEIVDSKQFVKLENDMYIPLVLGGSNNVSEFVHNREVRERFWYTFGKKPIVSEKELLGWAKKAQSLYLNCELFKENGRWVSNNDMLKWLKNCIQKAATIEEIYELTGCPLLVKVFNPSFNEVLFSASFKTSGELNVFLNLWESKGISDTAWEKANVCFAFPGRESLKLTKLRRLKMKG